MAGGDEMTALQHLGLTIELIGNQVNAAREFYLQAMRDQLAQAGGAQPQQRVRFDAPVGTPEERAAALLWPGHWVDANPYLSRYDTTGKWAIHTGADLNLNFPYWNADAHAPIYAPADGVVVVADLLPVWGKVVVVEIALEDGSKRWARLAHLEKFSGVKGQVVKRGDPLGTVGNAEGRYAWHLHYDIGKIDLGVKPTDWPGDDVEAVQRNYEDPLTFTRERHG